MRTIRFQHIGLRNIGPFEELDINFPNSNGISLICGDNGIGKTTILETIAATFNYVFGQRIKKKAGSEYGQLTANIVVDGVSQSSTSRIEAFGPQDVNQFQMLPQLSDSVINVRALRDFPYVPRDSIARDPVISEHQLPMRFSGGLDASEIKVWFSNRFLMRPHGDKGGWTPVMLRNVDLASQYFSMIDENVRLHSVDVTTFDILVETRSGVIPFEYLSSGFKSVYVLLLGITKEIEFRSLNVSAENFTGLILIDELDLHLHPTWQKKVAGVLTSVFPQAQIIATTHSPHVIQAAKASEVIALNRLSNGFVSTRELASSRFGFSGWTVDEVLEDVMGVEDTKTPVFREAMANFDSAIDSENAADVQTSLVVLREMLNPRNPLRKLIEIQAAPVLGNKE